ncbi:hypothetical protein ACOI1H_22275 [Loktanella sp. DJP18]|uniref:hypothetical protein n=1 Tax=Loktanella sp. DJP18 TaxID=3409788 RepID=UPI003BB70F7C
MNIAIQSCAFIIAAALAIPTLGLAQNAPLPSQEGWVDSKQSVTLEGGLELTELLPNSWTGFRLI